MNYKKIHSATLATLLSISLVACTGKGMIDTHEASVKNMQDMAQQSVKENLSLGKTGKQIDLPAAVTRALSDQDITKKKHHWQRFDIAVNKMSARQFFTHLSSFDKVNLVVSPKVTGSITINLHGVTLPEVLHAVSDAYGYQVREEEFGYKIVQESMVTRIYTIDWLALNRSGSSTMNINDVQGSAEQNRSNSGTSSTIDTSTTTSASSQVETKFGSADYWKEIKASIEQIIGADSDKASSKGSVTISQANGLVVVRATPTAQKLVARYLKSMHTLNSKQVVIDARILEVELTKDQKVGISDLGIPYLKWTNSGTASQLSYAKDPSNSDSTAKDFSNIIDTLSTVGHVSILSSPRVAILNNQKALIKVGEDEYYSMGNTTTYLTTSSSSTDPVESNNLQSFFSGVALDVTPQVDMGDIVTMHIHPIVSSITTVATKVSTSTSLDLPKTKIRETDTIVSAKSGQVIVIGGLISESSDLQHNKIPGMENKPYNSRRDDKYYKKELFILLRARVVDDKSWIKELDQVASYLGHSEDSAEDIR